MHSTTCTSAAPFEIRAGNLKQQFKNLLSGSSDLPLPGKGSTLPRWARLAEVAEESLVLVKLYEGHTDALAIISELGGSAPPLEGRWGTWCAEPPNARLSFGSERPGSREILISGTKSWCSGAALVTHAVVSGWDPSGEPRLAMVAMDQPQVQVTDTGWEAVGMAATASVDVKFDQARGVLLGKPHDYTARSGFWHGGAGIAACWFGGARAIARMTLAQSKGSTDVHRLAHLGAIEVAMSSAAALIRESAASLDAAPNAFGRAAALRLRLAIEDCAATVMHHAGRAVGAGPFCRDRRFARAMADLPVFIRQSHAERDLAALGGDLHLERSQAAWLL